MVIISASLILPFLLRVLGLLGEGFESESAFFVQFQLIFFAEIICNTINFRNFADKFLRGLFFVICLVINNKYTKNNPLFGLLLKLF